MRSVQQIWRLGASVWLVVLAGLCVGSGGCDDADADEGGNPAIAVRAGGDLTVADRSSNAYGTPAPNLDDAVLEQHLSGDAAFEQAFVSAPAAINPGLGPGFNNFSCTGCHPRDGRGMAVIGGPPLMSPMLVRVSLPDDQGDPAFPGDVVPVPGLGTQIQDHAVYGAQPEATIALTWQETQGSYGDGQPYSLRSPVLAIALSDGTPLGPDVMTSARIAPPVFGLGLLDAVPEATVASLADPDDADGDGISGRMNRVWSEADGAPVLGRFGWKANTATVELQTAAAYANDMGVSSPLAPEPDGTWELEHTVVEDTAVYVSTLGVPAPVTVLTRDAVRGADRFEEMGCASCHVPTLATGDHALEALRDQTFHAYTDLLVHDMGQGLADGRRDWQASGREWRTAPLWGIGLTQTVLPGATYLHDGRARTLAEAILWHGGEAEAARERFRTADAKARAELLAFLESR